MINQYTEMLKLMTEFGSKLHCTEFKPDSYVQIEMLDGCFFLWKSAFVYDHKGFPNWISIYTEHHGYYLYDAADVKSLNSNDKR